MTVLLVLATIAFPVAVIISIFLNRPGFCALWISEKFYDISLCIGLVSIIILALWYPKAESTHTRDNVLPLADSLKECILDEEDLDSNFIYDLLTEEAKDVDLVDGIYNFTFDGSNYSLSVNDKTDIFSVCIYTSSFSGTTTLFTFTLDKENLILLEESLQDFNLWFKYLMFLSVLIPLFGILCDQKEFDHRKQVFKVDDYDIQLLRSSALINSVLAVVLWYLVFFMVTFD